MAVDKRNAAKRIRPSLEKVKLKIQGNQANNKAAQRFVCNNRIT
jgi:hypothetical protein